MSQLAETMQGLCRNKTLVDLSHMRKHYTYITKNKQLWIYVVSLCVVSLVAAN